MSGKGERSTDVNYLPFCVSLYKYGVCKMMCSGTSLSRTYSNTGKLVKIILYVVRLKVVKKVVPENPVKKQYLQLLMPSHPNYTQNLVPANK